MKTFFWKDKSGRGFTCTMSLNDVLECEDIENWDGDYYLHEWAENAEPGDMWEDHSQKFICIEPIKNKTK